MDYTLIITSNNVGYTLFVLVSNWVAFSKVSLVVLPVAYAHVQNRCMSVKCCLFLNIGPHPPPCFFSPPVGPFFIVVCCLLLLFAIHSCLQLTFPEQWPNMDGLLVWCCCGLFAVHASPLFTIFKSIIFFVWFRTGTNTFQHSCRLCTVECWCI